MVRAWLWLAAEADHLEEKRRCPKATLELDPENETASLALLALDQSRPTSYAISHGRLRASSIGARIHWRPRWFSIPLPTMVTFALDLPCYSDIVYDPCNSRA